MVGEQGVCRGEKGVCCGFVGVEDGVIVGVVYEADMGVGEGVGAIADEEGSDELTVNLKWGEVSFRHKTFPK